VNRAELLRAMDSRVLSSAFGVNAKIEPVVLGCCFEPIFFRLSSFASRPSPFILRHTARLALRLTWFTPASRVLSIILLFFTPFNICLHELRHAYTVLVLPPSSIASWMDAEISALVREEYWRRTTTEVKPTTVQITATHLRNNSNASALALPASGTIKCFQK